MRRGKLIGRRLVAREVDRRVAALRVRVAAPNRFTALGMPLAEASG